MAPGLGIGSSAGETSVECLPPLTRHSLDNSPMMMCPEGMGVSAALGKAASLGQQRARRSIDAVKVGGGLGSLEVMQASLFWLDLGGGGSNQRRFAMNSCSAQLSLVPPPAPRLIAACAGRCCGGGAGRSRPRRPAHHQGLLAVQGHPQRCCCSCPA